MMLSKHAQGGGRGIRTEGRGVRADREMLG